jgi:hypothetical protein
MDETEEEIANQLNELQTLMASLDINRKNQITEESDDENKFVYDFGSESSFSMEEEPQVGLVKTNEQPESSEMGRKRGRQEDSERFIDQQIIQNKMDERKFKQIPSKYIPTINRHKEDNVLNIDCSEDTKKELRSWYHDHMVTIQLDPTLGKLSPKSIFNYLKTKTIGNAWSFMSEQSDSELPSTTEEVINHVYSILKKEFVGFDAPEAEADLMNTNIHRIFNLRICDMCYVEPFICEFSKYYYAISPQKRLQYNLLGLFYNKLPSSVGTIMEKIIQEHLEVIVGLDDTLGTRITALRKWISEKCMEKTAKREAKINVCCDRIQNKVGNYGCSKPRRKKKKKVFRKIDRSEYRRKKKFPKKFNKQKYFRRNKKYPKKNSCPKGKKTCTCWLCNEEGHYANECPKKKDSKKETLKLIWEVGFEPIESDIDSDESSIFEYTTEEEIEE